MGYLLFFHLVYTSLRIQLPNSEFGKVFLLLLKNFWLQNTLFLQNNVENVKSVYKQKEEKYHPQSCHQERTTRDILLRDISDYVCEYVCVYVCTCAYMCVCTHIYKCSLLSENCLNLYTHYRNLYFLPNNMMWLCLQVIKHLV